MFEAKTRAFRFLDSLHVSVGVREIDCERLSRRICQCTPLITEDLFRTAVTISTAFTEFIRQHAKKNVRLKLYEKNAYGSADLLSRELLLE